MPPPGTETPLNEAQVGVLRKWIESSAATKSEVESDTAEPRISDEERRFWSFQQPKKATVPRVRAQRRIRTPIDSFVLAKLEAKKGSPFLQKLLS
jgi:hypothetical protein